MQVVKPKKHLGQHFLTDQNIAFNIVKSLTDVCNTKHILEVGPGMGVLTKFLLENKQLDVWGIELDNDSIAYLHQQFPQMSDKLISADFLSLQFEDYIKEQFCIIGNFPYNISSQIVFKIIDNRALIPIMVGMFQKEVAERLNAKPRTKDYGILSIITQAYFNVEYLFTVPEHVFNPPPKVKSGVVRLQRKEEKIACDEILFKKVVKAGFNQRRKKLRNALQQFGLKDEDLHDYASKRAEELSVSDFVELTNIIQKHVNGKNAG